MSVEGIAERSPAPDEFKLYPGLAVGRNRYVLLQQIGLGGVGVVWLARDVRLDTMVALKFLSDKFRFDPAAIEDLRRETLKTLQLTHSNILRIYDFIEEEGEWPFISMERVIGSNLVAWRMKQKDHILTWDQLRPIVLQLCDALEYAHARRLVHRDIKPANIMVDDSGCVKLMDFGIAAAIVETISRLATRETQGTLIYMSPEQISGYGPRVTDDIYSVGVTCYELLTGKPPFYSGDVSYQVRHRPADAMEARLAEAELPNTIPSQVSATIMACLSKTATERPQTIREFKDRLFGGSADYDAYAKTETVLVTGPASRKKPALWPAAMTACLAVAGVLLFVTRKGAPEPISNPMPIAQAPAQTAPVQPAHKPYISNYSQTEDALLVPSLTEQGFDPLFGKDDLGKWKADPPEAWTVENGILSGRITQAIGSYLLNLEAAGDFELRFSWRADAIPGVSLSYRSPAYGEADLGTRYRILLSGNRIGTVLLSDEGRQLPSVYPGNIVHIEGDEWKLSQSATIPDTFEGVVRTNDWNDMIIVARGNRLGHFINGVRVSEIIDDRRTAVLKGGMFIRIVPVTAEYSSLQVKGMRLRQLPPLPPQTPRPQTFAQVRALSPIPSETEEGFRPFLSAMNGVRNPDEPRFWTLTNDVLKGRCDAPGKSLAFTWKQQFENFELRFSARALGRASVRYREQSYSEATDSPFFMLPLGDEAPGAIGFMHNGRITIAGPGTISAIREGKLINIASLSRSEDQVYPNFKSDEWHDYTIIAAGNRFTHYIDGVLFQEFINEDMEQSDASGYLSFRISTQSVSPPAEIEIKNARIKQLPNTKLVKPAKEL